MLTLRLGLHAGVGEAALKRRRGAHTASNVPAVLLSTHGAAGEEIFVVFDTSFGEFPAADPAAFRVKFRKMAISSLAVNLDVPPGPLAKTMGIWSSFSTFLSSSRNISSPLPWRTHWMPKMTRWTWTVVSS
ncbi:hypothetical protein [Streptomyces phaeofaciens]|uniref:hypothetical protein n=1 Tax=Streptomyces phaeofaciens TaxID=68254 RepID=UPI001671CD39|nr:hypothetical protein [Streptomyces phaeofaciens]